MPKSERMLLVNGDFDHELVPTKVRRLLAFSIFRARLIAYAHRELRFWTKKNIFGCCFVPKSERRLLVNCDFIANWCQRRCVGYSWLVIFGLG